MSEDYDPPADDRGDWGEEEWAGNEPSYDYAGPPDTGKATTAMVMGIVGLVANLLNGCFCGCGSLVGLVFSIVAFVMGRGVLRAIEEGRADPAGEGSAKAGKILGLIGIALNILILIAAVIFMVIYMVMIAKDPQFQSDWQQILRGMN